MQACKLVKAKSTSARNHVPHMLESIKMVGLRLQQQTAIIFFTLNMLIFSAT